MFFMVLFHTNFSGNRRFVNTMEENKLNTLHAVLLLIMDEIDRICRKNNIKYSLIGGSMLGAIRHGGFIPWDDDLDVGMLRDEYEKFIKACKKDLDDRFFLQTNESDPYYVYGFAKIVLKGTYLVQFGHENTKHQKGIYVDVFPFDYIPEDEKARRRQRNTNFVLVRLLRRKFGDKDKTTWGWKKRIAFFVGDIVNVFVSKKFLIDKLNANMVLYSKSPTKYVSNMSGYYGYNGETVLTSYFNTLILVQFENRRYPIVSEYDSFLKKYYGDYMKLPPVEKRRTHGFRELDFGKYKNVGLSGE